jgi:hypothetical protein
MIPHTMLLTKLSSAMRMHSPIAALLRRVVAVLVWEGVPRTGVDATEQFRYLALKAGFFQHSVATIN